MENLRHTERELYKLITWQLKRTGVCRWSNEGFARKLNKGITTVRDALRRLRLRGLLFVEARSGSTNLYTIKKPTPWQKPTPIIDKSKLKVSKVITINDLLDSLRAGKTSPNLKRMVKRVRKHGWNSPADVLSEFLSYNIIQNGDYYCVSMSQWIRMLDGWLVKRGIMGMANEDWSAVNG